jgi:hypothetical protein
MPAPSLLDGKREAAWQLVIGQAKVDGRFALWMGGFVEPTEEAVRGPGLSGPSALATARETTLDASG